MEQSTDKINTVLAFFSRPIVGILGSVASIIGFGLSIYFFIASREAPELTYFIHPAKAAVVRTNQASGLTVQFGGQNLTGDVTAAQIAFWNAGRKSIHAASILQPLIFRVGNKAKILEARLQKTSRDVAALMLDTSHLSNGEVGVNWKILEQNDGGIVQIIYAGDENTQIDAQAVLEGQPNVVRLEYAQTFSTPGEEYTKRQGWKGKIPGIIFAMMTLFMIFMLWQLKKSRRTGYRRTSKDWLIIAQIISMAVMSIWALVFKTPPGPPFGF